MPLPVIAGVYRCSILWVDDDGINPVNVFHVHSDSTDVEAVGSVVDTAFQAGEAAGDPFAALCSSEISTAFTILPLDGATGGVDVAWSTELQGGTGGERIPASAAVMSFKTAQRGARGRGRMYIGPLSESSQNAGALEGTKKGPMLDGWQAIVDSLDGADTPLGVASYRHRDFHAVTSIRIDDFCGTQRRRQDRRAGR